MNADDLYLLVGLGALSPDGSASYRQLSADLGVPIGFIQRHIAVLQEAGLVSQDRKPHLGYARELLVAAARFIAPARLGEVVPGIPTAWAAPPLARGLVEGGDLPPVWPSLDGNERGRSVQPLHKAAPWAAMKNPKLRDMLVLVDGLRLGDARVRSLAGDLLADMLADQSKLAASGMAGR